MARIDKEKLRQLAHNIMLDLSEQELEKLSNEFDVILKQMDLVQKIDTTNVHSMHFPFEITVTSLRDDEEIEQVPQAELLINAPVVEDNYIVINKVVK